MKTQLPPIKFIPYGITIIALLAFTVGFLGYKYLFPFYRGNNQTKASVVQKEDQLKITKTKISQNQGIIELSFDATKSAKIGENIQTNIVIDTGKKSINALDLVIKFDPQKVSISDNAIEILNKDLNVVNNKIDYQNGKIMLSVFAPIDQSLSGRIELGKMTIKPIALGNLELQVVFNGKGKKEDSNLIEKDLSEDILGKVINAKILVE